MLQIFPNRAFQFNKLYSFLLHITNILHMHYCIFISLAGLGILNEEEHDLKGFTDVFSHLTYSVI